MDMRKRQVCTSFLSCFRGRLSPDMLISNLAQILGPSISEDHGTLSGFTEPEEIQYIHSST